MGLPLPWQYDPSKYSLYNENLLKRMIIFRNQYERKKEERDEKLKKETVPKASTGHERSRQPKHHVRKPKRKHAR
jgi:hypothetical protein